MTGGRKCKLCSHEQGVFGLSGAVNIGQMDEIQLTNGKHVIDIQGLHRPVLYPTAKASAAAEASSYARLDPFFSPTQRQTPRAAGAQEQFCPPSFIVVVLAIAPIAPSLCVALGFTFTFPTPLFLLSRTLLLLKTAPRTSSALTPVRLR